MHELYLLAAPNRGRKGVHTTSTPAERARAEQAFYQAHSPPVAPAARRYAAIPIVSLAAALAGLSHFIGS